MLINSSLLVHDITFAVAVPNFAVFSPLGAEEGEYDGEESETCAKSESDANIHDNTVKEGEEEHPHHLLPSSDISRFAFQQSRFVLNCLRSLSFTGLQLNCYLYLGMSAMDLLLLLLTLLRFAPAQKHQSFSISPRLRSHFGQP